MQYAQPFDIVHNSKIRQALLEQKSLTFNNHMDRINTCI